MQTRGPIRHAVIVTRTYSRSKEPTAGVNLAGRSPGAESVISGTKYCDRMNAQLYRVTLPGTGVGLHGSARLAIGLSRTGHTSP